MTEHHEPPDVAEWMQKLAALPIEESAQRRSAAHLWWKAEILRRHDVERRLVAPIETAEQIIVGVAVFAAVILLRWTWEELSGTAVPAAHGLSISFVSLGITAAILAVVTYFVVRHFFQSEA